MPNLVSNSVAITFPTESHKAAFYEIAHVSEDYAETAILKALKVLLLGLSGHIRPSAEIPVLPDIKLPGVSYAPAGIAKDGSDAYSGLLDLISNNAKLTSSIIDQIDGIYEQSGAPHLSWDDLSEQSQRLFAAIAWNAGSFVSPVTAFAVKGDGKGFFNVLGSPVHLQRGVFSYDSIVCRSLVGALSGFDSCLFDGRSGYTDNIEAYGTKWNVEAPLELSATDTGPLSLTLQFTSSDSAPVEAVGHLFEVFAASGWHFAEDHEVGHAELYTYETGQIDSHQEEEMEDGHCELKAETMAKLSELLREVLNAA